MAKAKKKRLPKDFEALLEKGDLEELKALFASHDVNARGDSSKQTALAYHQCPDDLARWLVAQGADLEAQDDYGSTPLYSRSGHVKATIDVLLELGADVNRGENGRGTPLHAAAQAYRVATAALLLKHGARVDALNREGRTPLASALERCRNYNIERLPALAELLLAAGAQRTPAMKEYVTRIGSEFEFHRSAFNPDSLEATSAALDRLYAIFDVPPVPRRALHDGKSPIVARSGRWQDQFDELWELLVPSSGAAATVQGEVVRIAGRIGDELDRNGGVNWDSNYKQMASAFLEHVASGKPLAEELLKEAGEIVAAIRRRSDECHRLCEMAVLWVAQNPKPTPLPPPTYKR